MTQVTHIWARQNGKRAAMEKWINENIAAGYTVAIHTKDGIFCAKCDNPWDDCLGKCYEEKTD